MPYDVTPTIDNSEAMTEKGGVIIVTWTGIKQNYTCEPYKTAFYPDRSVVVTGTFGGATIAIKGDNTKALASVSLQALEGLGGTAISISSAGAATVVTPTYWTAPAVSSGGETTDLTVTMMITTTRA